MPHVQSLSCAWSVLYSAHTVSYFSSQWKGNHKAFIDPWLDTSDNKLCSFVCLFVFRFDVDLHIGRLHGGRTGGEAGLSQRGEMSYVVEGDWRGQERRKWKKRDKEAPISPSFPPSPLVRTCWNEMFQCGASHKFWLEERDGFLSDLPLSEVVKSQNQQRIETQSLSKKWENAVHWGHPLSSKRQFLRLEMLRLSQ